jgi:hypothetical protein
MPKPRDKYGNYHDDDLPHDKKKNKPSDAVTVALISAVASIIVAIIALFPINSSSEPYKPFIVQIVTVISGNNNQQTSPTLVAQPPSATLTQGPDIIVTSVSQTLTASAPAPDMSTAIAETLTEMAPTPDEMSTSVAGTLTAIAEETALVPTAASTATRISTSTPTLSATRQSTSVVTHTPAPINTATPTALRQIQSTSITTTTPASLVSNIPNGMTQYPHWSPGVYASSWLGQSQGYLTDRSAEVQEQNNQSYSFEVYIDSTKVATHGYSNGGIFWDNDSATCKYIPLDTVTTVTVTPGTSVWGMATDTTLRGRCQ